MSSTPAGHNASDTDLHFPPHLSSRCTSPGGSSAPRDHLVEASGQVRQAAAHLTRYRLNWPADGRPRRFLVVHKEHEQEALVPRIVELVEWLLAELPAAATVYLAGSLLDGCLAGRARLQAHVAGGRIRPHAQVTAEDVDLALTLGGDGTVLNAAWMFQQTVPPIMTFHLGTVGFLSMFDFEHFRPAILGVVEGGARVNIRMRLHCELLRAGPAAAPEFACNVMNEIVVDRGPSPYMALLDLYGDGCLLTSVLADGLIVATTTGSTAYSMSAGGSVVHPDVPAIMVTPICPHTLSLRPFIVPDSMELWLALNPASRSTAWASFDGRHRIELGHGDRVVIGSSCYPVTTVCRRNQTSDWFGGLSECLSWNERPGKHHPASHSM